MRTRLRIQVWWKSLIILAVVAAAIVGFITLTDPSNTLLQVLTVFSALVATIAGLASLWSFLDGRAARLLFLIQQVRNQVDTEAKSAISQLSAEGFLGNGSLKGANFQRALLSGAEIESRDEKGRRKGANLEEVDFFHAKLIGTWMLDSNLRNAKLYEADLTNARLLNANLSNADLTLCDLSGTDFRNANMVGANVAGALFSESTILPDGSNWTEIKDLSVFGIVDEIPAKYLHQDNNIEVDKTQLSRFRRLSINYDENKAHDQTDVDSTNNKKQRS